MSSSAPLHMTALRGQKTALGLLELELQVVVSHCVGAGIMADPLVSPCCTLRNGVKPAKNVHCIAHKYLMMDIHS